MKTAVSINCSICSSRSHSVFCDLLEDKLQVLKDHKGTRVYQKNEIIFNEGDKPTGLFCVFSGLIKIFKTSQGGNQQIIRLAKSGDVLGYRSFFAGVPYAGCAQVLQETTLCFIEKEGFEKLLHYQPELVYKLLKKVCVELGEAEQKFQDLLEKTVEERLFYFMKFMVKNNKSKTFELPLKREEIASLIGARPETVVRTFSQWRKKKIIQVKAKSVTILDKSLLQ